MQYVNLIANQLINCRVCGVNLLNVNMTWYRRKESVFFAPGATHYGLTSPNPF